MFAQSFNLFECKNIQVINISNFINYFNGVFFTFGLFIFVFKERKNTKLIIKVCFLKIFVINTNYRKNFLVLVSVSHEHINVQ